MNNPGGGGADLWGTSDAGGDDATLNDLLALYQSGSDMPPPFAPLADPAGLGEGLPDPGATGGSVDAEIDELIKSFQEAPAVFAPVPQAAPAMPPAIELSVDPLPAAAPPLAPAFGAPEAVTQPQAPAFEPPAGLRPPVPPAPPRPSFDVSVPPAPPLPTFEAPAPPAPPLPTFEAPAPPAPPLPTFEAPAPPAPPRPTFEALAPPAPPRPAFEPAAAVMPPAPPRPAFEPAAVVAPPSSLPQPTSFEDLIQSVVPATETPARPLSTISVAPLRPAPSKAVVASSGAVPALPAVDVGSSRQRLALAQQLTEVIANLAGGIDRVQSELDQLYSTLAQAASKRAPVEEILETTQALSDTKARVGEGSELFQQALLLKAVGEAYTELLRSI